MIKKSIPKPKSIMGYLHYGVESLNDNKFFIGILVLVLNVFSKYVEIKLTKISSDTFGTVCFVHTVIACVWLSVLLMKS